MITALVAASLAHYGALLQVPRVVRNTPVPLVDRPSVGSDDGFRDLWKTPF
jgi:hypothetical protein